MVLTALVRVMIARTCVVLDRVKKPLSVHCVFVFLRSDALATVLLMKEIPIYILLDRLY